MSVYVRVLPELGSAGGEPLRVVGEVLGGGRVRQRGQRAAGRRDHVAARLQHHVPIQKRFFLTSSLFPTAGFTLGSM